MRKKTKLVIFTVSVALIIIGILGLIIGGTLLNYLQLIYLGIAGLLVILVGLYTTGARKYAKICIEILKEPWEKRQWGDIISGIIFVVMLLAWALFAEYMLDYNISKMLGF